jgi:hypothetical protein
METLESIFVNRRVLYFEVDGVTCHLSVVAAQIWMVVTEVLHKQSRAADEHIGVGWGAKCSYVDLQLERFFHTAYVTGVNLN